MLIWNVRDYGATGDGTTDDTRAVQRAVDAAHEAGGGVVYFPSSTAPYMLVSVVVFPGLTILGAGARTIIRRPDRQPVGTRTFTTGSNAYTGPADSAPLIFRDFTIDGNRSNQGAYDKYEQEQSMLVIVGASPATAGRLSVTFENIVVRESVSDGIAIANNCDATIRNVRGINCFRGGVTVFGGHSRVRVSDCAFSGAAHPSGLHIEADVPGYRDSLALDVEASNVTNAGGLSVASAAGSPSRMRFRGIRTGAGWIVSGAGADIEFADSSFTSGALDEFVNRIVNPHRLRFSKCTFTIAKAPGATAYAAVHVYWNIGDTTPGRRLSFENCRWLTDKSIGSTDLTFAVHTEGNAASDDSRLTIDGGEIAGTYRHGLYMSRGGTWMVHGLSIDATEPLRLQSGDQATSWKVTIDGMQVGPRAKRWAHIANQSPRNTLTVRNSSVRESASAITTDEGVSANVIVGGRVILGSKAPTARTASLKGDVYRVSQATGAPKEWIARSSNASGKSSWRPK